MDFDSDLDIFLSDFAVDATYTPAGGTAKTIKSIFDSEYITMSPAGDIGVESVSPAAYCKTSALTGAKHGDTLVISGTTYYIVGIHPDGTGITILILSRDSG